MTQGFKYFMVFLSQSTKEREKKNEEGGEKKVEKWPVTLATSFLSQELILNLSQQDVLPT